MHHVVPEWGMMQHGACSVTTLLGDIAKSDGGVEYFSLLTELAMVLSSL